MASAPAQSRRPHWRTSLLVGGVLLVLVLTSLAAGVIAGSGRNTLALLFVLVPALPFLWMAVVRRPDLVVLLLPLAALAVPLDMPTGTDTKLPAVLLLTCAVFGMWVFTMIVRGHYQFSPTLLNRPMLIFCVLCCVSLVWGILWRDPVLIDSPKFIFVQIVSLISILMSIGAAVLIGNFVRTEAQLKCVVAVFLICGMLMTITQLLHINQRILNDRGLWGMWTVIPAYGLLIAQPKLRWYWRLALVALIGLTLYQTAVVNADWLSGWVPTIVALLAATFLRSKKAFVVLLIVAVVTAYGTRDYFISVANDNINDGSLERIDIAEQSWQVIREHWLFGTGPAGYAIYYMTYYRDTARSTHNNYLDILAQFGFSGMIAWLWLAVAALVEGWRLTLCAPPGFLRTLAIIATAGWIGAQASMLFGDWVLPFAYNQGVSGYKYTVYTWLFLGTLICIRRILSTQQAVPRPSTGEPL